jgi:hypothetical protein
MEKVNITRNRAIKNLDNKCTTKLFKYFFKNNTYEVVKRENKNFSFHIIPNPLYVYFFTRLTTFFYKKL